MARTPLLISHALAAAVAATLLAACGTSQPTVGVAPRIAEQEMPYRPGTGTVQSVNQLSGGDTRLGIRMSDGTMQYVDLDSRDVIITLPCASGSQIFLSSAAVIDFAQSFCGFTTMARPSYATGSST